MNDEKFFQLYMDQPAPPCDTCRHKRRCTREYLACEEFTRYVCAGCRAKWPKGERLPGREWMVRLGTSGSGQRYTECRTDALQRNGITPRVVEAAVQHGAVRELADHAGCSVREIEWVASHWAIRRVA